MLLGIALYYTQFESRLWHALVQPEVDQYRVYPKKIHSQNNKLLKTQDHNSNIYNLFTLKK